MRTVLCIVALLIALTACSTKASAEAARIGISAGYGGWVGDDFGTLEPGMTFGGEALFRIRRRLFLGPAFDYSSYDYEGGESGANQIDLDVVLRYYLPTEDRLLFLGGLIGWTRQDGGDSYLNVSSSGVAFGAAAGLSLPLGQVTADLSVNASYHLYGEADVGSTALPGSDRSGARFLARLGFGFPWGLVED